MSEAVRRNLFLVVVLLVGLSMIPTARAGDEKGGTWQFQLAPYAWLSGQKGDIASQPGFPAAPVDVDFYDDIVGNINGALFLVAEARKNRFGIVTDIAYSDIDDDDVTPGPLYSGITSRTKTWIVSGAGFYRLVEDGRSFLDLLAGIRYWSVDSTLNFKEGVLPAARITNQETWLDPVAGLKGLVPFGNSRFFVSGGFGIGGFGIGSDLMWDAMLNLGYQWSKGIATTIGYRYLDVDYEDDGFLYDVAQQGLLLGLSWRF